MSEGSVSDTEDDLDLCFYWDAEPTVSVSNESPEDAR